MNMQMLEHIRLLCVLNIEIIYFDSFGVEHVPKVIRHKFIGHKNIKTIIFRIQASNSIMC